jgi:hypothetical protein
MAMENVLHCALEMGAGRVDVTYGLGFGLVPGFTPTLIPMSMLLSLASPTPAPYQCQLHMHKEFRSYAKANTAGTAAFDAHPDANVFLRLIQFMLLRLRHQLGERHRLALLHIHALTYIHVDALSSPTHSHIWTQSPFLFLQHPLCVLVFRLRLLAGNSMFGFHR